MGKMMRCCAFGALAFVSVAYAAQCTSEAGEIPGIQARLDMCPASAPFWGFMGCMMALVFSCPGAAYGTAKSGVGVGNMGVLHADMVMKSIIPIIMAGVLGIYGLIVAVLLASSITGDNNYSYSSYSGYWELLWPGWPGCRRGHLSRRRCWCSVQCPQPETLRRCHPHSHLR